VCTQVLVADVSPHPDELIPVAPVMPYGLADPPIVDPVSVISDIDAYGLALSGSFTEAEPEVADHRGQDARICAGAPERVDELRGGVLASHGQI
jgi:hypothetical protein